MIELNKDHYKLKHIDFGEIHVKLTPKGRDHIRKHATKSDTIVGLALPMQNFYGPCTNDVD